MRVLQLSLQPLLPQEIKGDVVIIKDLTAWDGFTERLVGAKIKRPEAGTLSDPASVKLYALALMLCPCSSRRAAASPAHR